MWLTTRRNGDIAPNKLSRETPARDDNGRCTLKVRVQPRASRNQIDGYDDGTVRLRVTAPPEGDRANAAAIALLADSLAVSKSRLEIVRGHAARDKVVAVDSFSLEEAALRLGSVLG